MVCYICKKNNEETYFDKSDVEQIPKDVEKFMGNKDSIANFYWIQDMIQ